MKKFYKTEQAFAALHARLKLMNCPHCQHRGCLILHGYLYGFTESDKDGKVQRGHRIFCSNRKKKNGCGKTFSMLIAEFIKNHIISSKTVSNFLDQIKDGKSRAEANRNSGSKMKESTVYRIYKKFKYNQVRIRTLLLKIKPPPLANHLRNAVMQTICHLKSVFEDHLCPVSQFQYHFQTSFF